MPNEDVPPAESLTKKVPYRHLCRSLPYLGVVLFFALMAFFGPTRITHVGESDDYILLSIAFQNHASDQITESDIEQARRSFTGMSWDFFPAGPLHLPISVRSPEGATYYSWYFITYSLFCIPFERLVGLLGVHPVYGFYLANLCILLLSVYFAERWLRKAVVCPRLLPYLLLWTPSLVYLFWPSAEVFLMACATLSAAALFSGRYLTAAFWSGVAASMNITFMLFYPFLYVKYFFQKDTFINLKKEVIKRMIAHTLGHPWATLLFILYTFMGFIPVIINLLRWKRMAVMQDVGSTAGLMGRFVAYIVDLNFGILPYFPFLLPLIFFLLLFTKKKELYFFTVSIIGIMISFSLMTHINCGMGFLSRYLSWTIVLLTIGIVYYSFFIESKGIAKIIHTFLLVSVLYTSSISFIYFIKYKGQTMNYLYMLALPQKVMQIAPAWYNPLPSTFNSRINNVDGGYDVKKKLPILYRDKKGNIRKALLNKESARHFFERIHYPSYMKGEIRKKKEKSRSTSAPLFYLSFDRGVTLD